ncbi:hypothetical protein MMC11_003437 [Xylographa trunciseda]|nr:hypothetical protein [Xylographa trunciseda]
MPAAQRENFNPQALPPAPTVPLPINYAAPGANAQDLTPGILQSVAALNSAYDPISDPSATSNVAASSASAPVIISTTTGVTLSHTSSTGSLSSMSISTAAAAASSSSTPQNITSQYSSGPPTAAIAGGVVGGLAVLALLIGLLLWYCRRNVRSSRRHMDDSRAFSSAAGLAAGDDAACVEKPSPSVYTYQTPDSLKAPPHSAAISPAPLAYNHPAELHNESSPVPSFQGFPSPPRSPYGLGVSNRDELHMGEAERFMTVSPGLSMGSPGPYRDVEVSELDSGGGGAGTSR